MLMFECLWRLGHLDQLPVTRVLAETLSLTIQVGSLVMSSALCFLNLGFPLLPLFPFGQCFMS